MKRRALLISGRVYHSSPHGEKAYIQAAWPSLGYHYFCFLPFTSRGIPLSSCCLKGCRRNMKNYGLPWDCGPLFCWARAAGLCDSYFYESSAFSMVLDRIGPSSRLIIGAVTLALIIGVLLGILVAIGMGI
jgi:hypothetical protein